MKAVATYHLLPEYTTVQEIAFATTLSLDDNGSLIWNSTLNKVRIFSFPNFINTPDITTTTPIATQIAQGLVPATGVPTGKYLKDDMLWSLITKNEIGLGNADNTSDINKIVSTPQQTALNLKQNLPTLVAVLAADATTGADVNPISLSGLVFTYVANSVYKIWFMGRISAAAATTGCAFQFDLSSAVTDISIQFYHQLANTGTLTGGHSIADDASVGISSGIPATSNYPIIGQGLLRTGANGGTAQLRFRSETTAAITARAGLVLTVEKLI